MRFEIMLVGLGGVALIGLLGRELAGDRVGLIAAGIAAVYPYLWVNDGLIMSEAFAVAAVTGALLLLFRLVRRPSLWLALVIGIICGLAALARAELVLLAPLLGLPLLVTFRREAWSRRLGIVAVLGVGAVLVVGPWVAYNFSRFEDPTFISTNDGIAILGSNCPPSFYGPSTGLTSLDDCIPKRPPRGDQSGRVTGLPRPRLRLHQGAQGRAVVVELARVGPGLGRVPPRGHARLEPGRGPAELDHRARDGLLLPDRAARDRGHRRAPPAAGAAVAAADASADHHDRHRPLVRADPLPGPRGAEPGGAGRGRDRGARRAVVAPTEPGEVTHGRRP